MAKVLTKNESKNTKSMYYAKNISQWMLTAFWGPSVSTKKHLSSYSETVVEQANVMPAESLLGGEDSSCSPNQMDN